MIDDDNEGGLHAGMSVDSGTVLSSGGNGGIVQHWWNGRCRELSQELSTSWDVG